MRNKLHWKKRMITLAAAAVLMVVGTLYGSASTVWATPASGTSVSSNIVVRESAVDGAQIGSLTEGQEVSIVDETTGSDGYTWYQISFVLNGTESTGWVRGDLLNTSDESVDIGADTDTEPEGASEEKNASLVFDTQNGSITLTDIPEEELALVSDRFVETTLDFEEGTVAALQLAEPDELVSDDAAIVDYYYVYGYNEIGEAGWYVYNTDDGTIQKNLLNMQYSIAEAEADASEESSDFSSESLTRMMISALGVICLLLLILAIAFSVRYRRLRRILEEEIGEEDIEEPEASVRGKKRQEEPYPEEKKNHGPEPAKVNKGQKPKEPVRAKQQAQEAERKKDLHTVGEYGAEEYEQTVETPTDPVEAEKSEKADWDADKMQIMKEDEVPEKRKIRSRKHRSDDDLEEPEPMTEIGGVDVMDLDSMDDTDYEALLNRYLEEDLAAGESAPEEPGIGDSDAEAPVADDIVSENFTAREDAGEHDDLKEKEMDFPDSSDSPEDDYDIPLEEGADYDITDDDESDIIDLSKLRMPDEEPEFYDDEDDDDLTFL